METKNLNVIVKKAENNFLEAQVKELPAVVTQGKNEQELKRNVLDALDLYFHPHLHKYKLTYQNI
jgi:predicted RNase H-like HicB family nuclease